MRGKAKQPTPEPIVQLQRQLDQFRSTQPRRTKLHEPLLDAGVDSVQQHGVFSVVQPLRLDYMDLKKQLCEPSSHRRKARRPAFVELIAPPAAVLEECVIEFESSHGAKMRIQWKASAPPDWASLLRAWRETEG